MLCLLLALHCFCFLLALTMRCYYLPWLLLLTLGCYYLLNVALAHLGLLLLVLCCCFLPWVVGIHLVLLLLILCSCCLLGYSLHLPLCCCCQRLALHCYCSSCVVVVVQGVILLPLLAMCKLELGALGARGQEKRKEVGFFKKN